MTTRRCSASMSGRAGAGPDMRAGLSAAAALLVGAGAALALPPDPQLDRWRGPLNNDYNYSINQRDNDFKQPGGGHYDLPPVPTSAQVGAKVKQGCRDDGLVNIDWAPGQAIPLPPEGYNLVALMAKGGEEWDYNTWRLNGDGTWSQKIGQTPAQTTYADAQGRDQTMTDPREAAQRGGFDLVGFMGTPKAPVGDFQEPLFCPPGAERVWLLVHAGLEDDHADFFNLAELATHLPTGPEVPDPHWGGVMAGESMGLGMVASSEARGMGFAVYMRVFEGVVAEYGDLQGDVIRYYEDNHGLGAAVPGPGGAALFGLAAACAARRRRGVRTPGGRTFA
jgi:hypothetical protein